MADPDASAQTGHPDVAGWVLGVLDPDDGERFEAHLPSCEECQQAVAELGPAAQMLKTAMPAIEVTTAAEPPPDGGLQRRAQIPSVMRWDDRRLSRLR